MSTQATNTFYLVRHGENTANITKEFSYKQVDYALTDPKGREQARQTAEFFKHIPLDAIYTSPLKRARETAEWIARPHNLPLNLLEEVREVNIGDLEIPAPSYEILMKNWKFHDSIIREWMKGNHSATFPGGENYLGLLDRTRRGLLTASQGRANQHILISSHGGTLAAIVRGYCHNHQEKIIYSGIGNCAITTIELTTDGENINGVLETWASVAHLSGEAARQISPRPEDEVLPR